MNESQYQMNEIIRFNKECQETEKAPLESRKQGKEAFKHTLETDLSHFLDCVNFLVNGDYGAGAKFSFERLTKRMNRRAWLFNTVAVIEYGTSIKYACEVWHSLDTDLQIAINAMLDDVLKNVEAQ